MPRRRPLPLRSLAFGVVAILTLGGCGPSDEVESTTPTTEVAAAAGSGFCLTWTRYRDSLLRWAFVPPADLDESAGRAEGSLRDAEESRSVAPEGLVEPLDTVVAAQHEILEGVREAETKETALAGVAARVATPDFTTAVEQADLWVASTC